MTGENWYERHDEWPTPKFVRPGVFYPCRLCGEFSHPDEGDAEAGLLLAGDTTKLCANCADGLRDAIDRTPEGADLSDLADALEEVAETP